MTDFKLRPLHRQRSGRRKPVSVLSQTELAERLGVHATEVKARLDELGWRYHEDGAGNLWATADEE